MIRPMCSASLYQAQLRTPFCVVGIQCADDRLTGIRFLAADSHEQSPHDAFTREVCAQLSAYFAKANFQFDIPLNLEGTAHQRNVWQALQEISYGQVQTYGELAKRLGSSPRAVGQACGNNPIPLVVPCHRVVSQTGQGGFMHHAEGDFLNIKRWLLAHEQR